MYWRALLVVLGWSLFGVVATVIVGAALSAWYYVSVPVDLPVPAHVYTDLWDRGIVRATGTFVFEDNAAPLQTSLITCIAPTNECQEARAEVRMGNLLNVNLDKFDIKKWDHDYIVYLDDNVCFHDIYTIVRASAQLFGVREKKTDMGERCSIAVGSAERIEFRLADGFSESQKLHNTAQQKVLPLVMLLLASVWLLVFWRILIGIKRLLERSSKPTVAA